MEERYHSITADLSVLETVQEIKFTGPVVTGDANDRPKVSLQKLVVIPMERPPYFMEPQLPWGALLNFKKFLGEIP